MTPQEKPWTWKGMTLPLIPAGVEFDEALHQYRIDARQAPGVTGLLADEFHGNINSPKVKWGTATHDHIFHFLLGTIDQERIQPVMLARIEGFLRAMAKLRCAPAPGKWLGEFFVVSRRFGYCGRLDNLFDRGATDLILDVKTGDDSEHSQLLAGAQIGGYAQALVDMGLTSLSRLRGAVVFIGDDGAERVVDVNMREAVHVFLARLTWMKYMRKI